MLSSEESKFQALVEAIPGFVSWFNESCEYLGVNRSLAESYGLHPADFIGKKLGFLDVPGTPNIKSELETFFATTRLTHYAEVILDSSHGSRKFLMSFQKYNGLKCAVVVGIDITSTWKLEEQTSRDRENMANSARLSALGEMAGSIAHEINNPLAVIQATSRKIARMVKDAPVPKDVFELLSNVESTVLRIGKIIRTLRVFSRDGRNDPMINMSLSMMIEDAFVLCEDRFRKSDINLVCESIPEHFSIRCRPVQIGQVIVNLLNNSFDAVEKLSEKWVRLEVKESDSSYNLYVIDSGHGIDPELAKRIMDPYFTTKKVGFGTGLGLSIAKNIVEEHQGTLEYDASHSHTCFVLRFPKKPDLA